MGEVAHTTRCLCCVAEAGVGIGVDVGAGREPKLLLNANTKHASNTHAYSNNMHKITTITRATTTTLAAPIAFVILGAALVGSRFLGRRMYN